MEEVLCWEKPEEVVIYSQSKTADDSAWLSQNTFNDRIYGNIVIEPEFADIITTFQFERLQNINQLGGVHFVNSAASHTRYEHCIGTMNVASQLLDSIISNQKDGLSIEHGDRMHVLAAALCHDLGHGPFSHTFDNYFMQVRFPELNWTHERWSVELFEHMLDQNHIDHFDKYDIRIIQNYILGVNDFSEDPTSDNFWTRKFDFDSKGWMFDIVNNKRNSFDVDKLDYLQRDTGELGLSGYDFDYFALINGARVFDNQICYPYSTRESVKDVYEARYGMFHDVYCSDMSIAVDKLICDILNESNDYFRFEEVCQDLDEYWKLTDDVLGLILKTDDSSLYTAHKLIQRLQAKDVYKAVVRLPFKTAKKHCFKELTPEKIAWCSKGTLKPSDIQVSITKINYGMGERNPLESIMFYDDTETNTFYLGDELNELTTHYKNDPFFHVFATDNEKTEEVQQAAIRAISEYTGESFPVGGL